MDNLKNLIEFIKQPKTRPEIINFLISMRNIQKLTAKQEFTVLKHYGIISRRNDAGYYTTILNNI